MTPLTRGFLLAFLAAVAFGATAPLIDAIGRGTGAWSTAALLYFGSASFAATMQKPPRATLQALSRHWGLLFAVASIGGMLAPAAFILGLHHSGALSASLALNMEAPFSVAIAAVAFHEHVGKRLMAALFAIVAGGAVLMLAAGPLGSVGFGVLFVIGATGLWALDNALSSRLADVNPRTTVFWKSLIGAILSLVAGVIFRDAFGSTLSIVGLICVGAIGYGASLVCYLIAQRTFGVGRTASVFAVAPFVGAGLAIAMGDRSLNAATCLAFTLIALGVYLHVTERHSHVHTHVETEHTHLHVHDDGHHDHLHDEMIHGDHSHLHRHQALTHQHDHAPDPHHVHSHRGNAIE